MKKTTRHYKPGTDSRDENSYLLLSLMVEHATEWRAMPTIHDLAAAMGYHTSNSPALLLQYLEREGVIVRYRSKTGNKRKAGQGWKFTPEGWAWFAKMGQERGPE